MQTAATGPVAPNPSARRADLLAMLVLILYAVGIFAMAATYERWIGRNDTIGYFLPTYSYLGAHLREFDLPLWNPHYFAGQPFIGDPATGWLYLPVMVAFGLFSPLLAYKVLLLLIIVIGGLAMYGFCRAIAFGPLPAVVTAAMFLSGSVAWSMISDATATALTMPLIAVALLGVERAMRAGSWQTRTGWSALIGLGVAHSLASWPTNGLLMVLLYLVAWTAYRVIVDLVEDWSSRWATLGRMAQIALTAILVCIGYAGATLWPTLLFSEQSPVAGGDYSTVRGGGDSSGVGWFLFLTVSVSGDNAFGINTLGGVFLIPAVFAVIAAPKRLGVLAFAFIAVLAFDLGTTLGFADRVMFTIPGFELIHTHRASAMARAMYPALHVLCGAGLQAALEDSPGSRRWRQWAGAVLIGGAFLVVGKVGGASISPWAVGCCIAITIAVFAIVRSGRPGSSRLPVRLAAVVIVGLIVLYPIGNSREWRDIGNVANVDLAPERTEQTPPFNAARVDFDWTLGATVAQPAAGSAGAFLQMQRDSSQPFRYVTYDGKTNILAAKGDPPFTLGLGLSRASFTGLETISGYNPLGLDVYHDFVTVMNDQPQDYHFRSLLPGGLESRQLLSLLNVRYVLIPRDLGQTPVVAHYWTEVFRDEAVIVYENPDYLPRAWMVHEVLPLTDWARDSVALRFGTIDARETAFVAGDLPVVAPLPADAPPDRVFVSSHAPERIEVRAETAAAGLLVVSEIYADGWTATVNGEEVPIHRTNQALRGIAVPAGESTVVLSYEPTAVTIGLWSTGVTSVALIGFWGWLAVDRRWHGRDRRTWQIRRRAPEPVAS